MMELFLPQGGTFGLPLPCRGIGNCDHGHGLWFPLCGIGAATQGCCRLPALAEWDSHMCCVREMEWDGRLRPLVDGWDGIGGGENDIRRANTQ